MEDEFVDIIGYEGLYQINRLGEIINILSDKKMKDCIGTYGYKQCSLTKDKIRKCRQIHRLLAIQFIPNPNNFPQIDHIDKNKLNNNLENLRWCDCKTNSRNRTTTINRKGCINIKRITEKGEYYEARFRKDYGKSGEIRRQSYNKNELEEWLIEMRNEYARNEIYV
jgi:hypothetical protein